MTLFTFRYVEFTTEAGAENACKSNSLTICGKKVKAVPWKVCDLFFFSFAFNKDDTIDGFNYYLNVFDFCILFFLFSILHFIGPVTMHLVQYLKQI